MYLWLAYDISLNKSRRKVAIQCKRVGLVRIQKSVFMGRVSKLSYQLLKDEATALIKKTDKLYMMPITPEMYKNMLLYGASFNKERITTSIVNIVL